VDSVWVTAVQTTWRRSGDRRKQRYFAHAEARGPMDLGGNWHAQALLTEVAE
jgi:hypothetical protein